MVVVVMVVVVVVVVVRNDQGATDTRARLPRVRSAPVVGGGEADEDVRVW